MRTLAVSLAIAIVVILAVALLNPGLLVLLLLIPEFAVPIAAAIWLANRAPVSKGSRHLIAAGLGLVLFLVEAVLLYWLLEATRLDGRSADTEESDWGIAAVIFFGSIVGAFVALASAFISAALGGRQQRASALH